VAEARRTLDVRRQTSDRRREAPFTAEARRTRGRGQEDGEKSSVIGHQEGKKEELRIAN